jgi:hypothetical protein
MDKVQRPVERRRLQVKSKWETYKMKKCSICKENRNLTEYSKRSNGTFQARCKLCDKEYHKTNYIKKRDKIIEKSRIYYYNNIDKVKETHSKYYHDNKEWLYPHHQAWFKANPEKYKEYHKKFQAKLFLINPEYVLEKNANRRAMLKKAVPKWANRDNIRKIYKEAKEKSKKDNISYHVDHIIPLQNPFVCGLHVETNLRIIKASENHKKSNKLLDYDSIFEFYNEDMV